MSKDSRDQNGSVAFFQKIIFQNTAINLAMLAMFIVSIIVMSVNARSLILA